MRTISIPLLPWSSHWQYLRYLIRHKWFVLVAGLRLRVPLWRLLVHDWSKFTAAEWTPYVEKYYGPPFSSNWIETREERAERVEAAYRAAWHHHVERNDHHPEYWRDAIFVSALEMPEAAVREMVADWIGAGKAKDDAENVYAWYARQAGSMYLHPKTRTLVERLLSELADNA